MSSIHSIKSNARRAARKAGIDPELVYAVPEGWKCPDAPSIGAVLADIDPVEQVPTVSAVMEQIAAKLTPAPITAATNPKNCPKCSAVFGSCNHTMPAGPLNTTLEQIAAKIAPVVAKDINTATALVADLDAKAAKRVKAKTIKKAKPTKPAKAKIAAKVRGKRDGVCNKVIDAIHARWTSIDELLALSGWQRHTLRGYISTRAAKDKFVVEKRKVDGVPQYRVAG